MVMINQSQSPAQQHFALIVDESSSIEPYEAGVIREGLTRFVDSQSGTCNTISLIGMSYSENHQRRDHILNAAATTRDGHPNEALVDWITRYRTGRVSLYSDNWHSAILVVNELGLGDNDEIIIVTNRFTTDSAALQSRLSGYQHQGTQISIITAQGDRMEPIANCTADHNVQRSTTPDPDRQKSNNVIPIRIRRRRECPAEIISDSIDSALTRLLAEDLEPQNPFESHCVVPSQPHRKPLLSISTQHPKPDSRLCEFTEFCLFTLTLQDPVKPGESITCDLELLTPDSHKSSDDNHFMHALHDAITRYEGDGELAFDGRTLLFTAASDSSEDTRLTVDIAVPAAQADGIEVECSHPEWQLDRSSRYLPMNRGLTNRGYGRNGRTSTAFQQLKQKGRNKGRLVVDSRKQTGMNPLLVGRS